MRLTRCFVPAPLREHTELRLPEAAARHVARVLRLRPGATLTLFDGRGGEFESEITSVQRDTVAVAVGSHRLVERESPVRTVLLQSLARAERMDLIVQKATELGVSAIFPLASEHSVVRLEAETAVRRAEHWRQIAIGACEQCGRNRVPPVHEILDLERAAAQAGPGLRCMLAPEAQISLAHALAPAPAAAGSIAAGDIVLLIGPEGGWSERELAAARQLGFRLCHLGPRILRAETAPLAALAIVQALTGDSR